MYSIHLLTVYGVCINDVNTCVTIYSNKLDMSARPLRDFFPYYAISAAYNSPIMHNGRLAERRALKWRHFAKNINNVSAIKWRRYGNVVG